MAKGGGMKKSKGMARGGAMKMAKGMARGGAMKKSKYMSLGGALEKLQKGGAAAREERKALGGIGAVSKSVMSALMGGGNRAAGQANKLRQPKGMARGGAMKKTKYRAIGGPVVSPVVGAMGLFGRVSKKVQKPKMQKKSEAAKNLASKAVKQNFPSAIKQAPPKRQKKPNETVVIGRRRKGTLAPGKPGSRKR